jgi:hypothetical protein
MTMTGMGLVCFRWHQVASNKRHSRWRVRTSLCIVSRTVDISLLFHVDQAHREFVPVLPELLANLVLSIGPVCYKVKRISTQSWTGRFGSVVGVYSKGESVQSFRMLKRLHARGQSDGVAVGGVHLHSGCPSQFLTVILVWISIPCFNPESLWRSGLSIRCTVFRIGHRRASPFAARIL